MISYYMYIEFFTRRKVLASYLGEIHVYTHIYITTSINKE